METVITVVLGLAFALGIIFFANHVARAELLNRAIGSFQRHNVFVLSIV